ncbi:hypothetical protein CN481_15610 [Bacillus sp. AFS006103]|nr:hypothetical protein CN481_15610 [Bacillus sp. AFS006103]
MHIAIEGLDGVGKTTVATKVAAELDFTYIEKPLQYLFDNDDSLRNYKNITSKINSVDDGFMRMWFYAMGNIFLNNRNYGTNFITDRYFVSTFIHNQNEYSDEIMKVLIRKLHLPAFTVVLYAGKEERKRRMINRNPEDPDLFKLEDTEKMYLEIKQFLDKYGFNYIWVDTTDITIDEIVNIIITNVKVNNPF